ncbi:MAG: T9SS type A sorting domain-containing protein [Chlorobi bacterium]|nr:T9SS type A sorting domain-containing protein [Chlorobiota bacterium]
MKKQVTLFVSLLFATALFAQSFQLEWYNSYTEIPATSSGQTIVLDQNDSIVMAGKASDNTSGGGAMFYLKADSDGNIARVTYAESQYTNSYQDAHELIEDNDGNYVMVGSYDAYGEGTYFTKISPLGEVLGTTINGGQFDYHEAHDVEHTFDGGYLILAPDFPYDSGFCVGIRKTNSLGQYEWSKSYYKGKFLGMAKTGNTEFIVTGYRNYASGSGQDLDMILAKININGDILWTKTYQEPDGNEIGTDIQVLPNNEGYIMCGQGPDFNYPNYTDGIIQKVDLDGNIIWKKTYTRATMSYTDFIKVLQDGNGDFLVLARTQAGSSDISLLKYSQSGTLLQESHFDNGWNETAFDMALDSQGAIYISANIGDASILKIIDTCPVDAPEASLVDPTPVVGDDIIVAVANTNTEWEYSLVQINGNVTLGTAMGTGSTYYFDAGALTPDDVLEGLLVSVTETTIGCSLNSDTLFVDFITGANLNDKANLSISPNPFLDYIMIRDNENTVSKLSVFDLNGRLLVEKKPISKNPKINLSQLSKGIYFLGLTYRSGEKRFQKIVKE